MNLGVPEVLIILTLVGGLFLFCTVYAIVRAANAGDTPWIIGIAVGWVFGMGWLVGLIYLLVIDRPRARPAVAGGHPPAPGVPLPPPSGPAAAGPPAGWHPDPRGRFELRYWDGSAWTDNVSTAGRPDTDRL